MVSASDVLQGKLTNTTEQRPSVLLKEGVSFASILEAISSTTRSMRYVRMNVESKRTEAPH